MRHEKNSLRIISLAICILLSFAFLSNARYYLKTEETSNIADDGATLELSISYYNGTENDDLPSPLKEEPDVQDENF